MRQVAVGCAAIAISVLTGTGALCGQQMRSIQPSDCVTVRSLLFDDISWHSTIKISPDGRRVAYPVRIANLSPNKNEIEVYARNASAGANDSHSDTPILMEVGISSLQWRSDSRHLVYLLNRNGKASIEQLDVVSGARSIFVSTGMNVAEFSIDSSGDTIVFGVDLSGKDSSHRPTQTEIDRGYRIPYQEPEETIYPQRKVFATHLQHGVWSRPTALVFRSPLSGTSITPMKITRQIIHKPGSGPCSAIWIGIVSGCRNMKTPIHPRSINTSDGIISASCKMQI